MPDLNMILAAPVRISLEDTDTNAPLAVQIPARTQMRFYVTGFSLSVDRAPVSTGTFTITNNGDVMERIEIPTALFSPIVVEYKRPLECEENTTCDAALGALGAAVLATIVIRGFYARS